MPAKVSSVALVVSTTLLFVACGGGNSTTTESTQAPDVVTPPVNTSSTKITMEAQGVEFATVQSLAMDSLSSEFDPTAPSEVSVTGVVRVAYLDGTQLRFLMDTDHGKSMNGSILLTQGKKIFAIPVEASSKQIFEPVVYAEPDDDLASGKNFPALKLAGLAEGNAMIAGEFHLSLEGGAAVDPNDKKFILYSKSTGEIYNFTQYLKFDSVTNSFKVSAEDMSTILAALPAGEYEATTVFMVGVSADPVVYEFSLSKSTSSMVGTVVDSVGASASGLSNAFVSITSYNGTLRILTTPDTSGNFSIASLPPGTYDVRLYDATLQSIAAAAVPIYPGTTSVSVQLKTSSKSTAASAKMPMAASEIRKDGTTQAAPVQTGPTKRPATREIGVKMKQAAAVSSCLPYSEDGKTLVSVSSADQDQRIACPVNIPVPKGTKEIRVTTHVTTEEFPEFTKIPNNPYNDSWDFKLTLPKSGVAENKGSVNQSHRDTGTTRVLSRCISVNELTTNNEYLLQGEISTTNIGDSSLSTTVTVSVENSCTALVVTSASASRGTLNSKTYKVFGQKAESRPMVSISAKSAPTAWGFPVEINYSPANAVLSQIRLGILQNGVVQMSDVNLISKAVDNKAGRLKFVDLQPPVFPGLSTTVESVQLLIELSGTVDGVAATTDARDSALAIDGRTDINVLLQLGDFVPLSRRFNPTEDVGGDSWGLNRTYQWVMKTSYLFNDINALHAASLSSPLITPSGTCPAKGSVLCHAGHNTGLEIDLRYLDETGTSANGALNGAPSPGKAKGYGILDLISLAKAEAATLSPAPKPNAEAATLSPEPKPNLVKLQKWIAQNRAMLEKHADDAEKIFVSKQIRLVLQGNFDRNTPIPGVTEWDKEPIQLYPHDAHKDHWHITLKNF